MSTALVIASPNDTDYTSKKVAAASVMTFHQDPSRPVRLLVENGNGSSCVVTFVRSQKFADGTTMSPNNLQTMLTGTKRTFTSEVDFPISECGNDVEVHFSVTSSVTVLATY